MEELLHDPMANSGGVVHVSGDLLFLEAPCTQEDDEDYHKEATIFETSHQASDKSNNILCFLKEVFWRIHISHMLVAARQGRMIPPLTRTPPSLSPGHTGA
jgi:hypothetical protein